SIEKDHAILSVVDDVRQLIRRQAEVEGVEHRAETGDCEVQLEMTVTIPAERPDAIAGLDAEPRQCVGEAMDAFVEARIRIAGHAVGGPSGDFFVGELLWGPA